MGRLKVYLRLKPISPSETNISEIANDTTVIIDPRIGNQKPSTLSRKAIRYTFKKIFEPTCSQRDLFRRVALPSVRDVLSGKPALIFINGAAGSGKTHTIIGTPEDAGILPRVLDVVFNSIPSNLLAMKFVFKPDKLNGYDVRLTEDAMIDRQNVLLTSGSRISFRRAPGEERESNGERRNGKEQSSWAKRDSWEWEQTKVLEPRENRVDEVASDFPEDCRVAVFVQFVEIYNNCVYDLLDEETPDAQDANRGKPWKNIRHDASKSTYVYGAKEVEVENADEAMDAFIRGQARRRASHTQLNAGSFGGHSVYTIKLVQAPLNEGTTELVQEKDFISVTQFSLVDLAGSDGVAADSTLDYSSMCLRSCLNTVRENQSMGSTLKVPYRDSRLTHLFKNFFEGIGSIKILLCVNPRSEDYSRTLEVLKFSESAEEIEIDREQTNRKLTFVELSPAPSIEDLYTTAYDMASTQAQPQGEKESLNLNNLRIQDAEFDATIEDKDTVSFSSAEVLNDEIQNVISKAASRERKYRRKSKILEETIARLNQVQREKDYFKKRLIEVEAQKESMESQLLNAEESLREVQMQKLKIDEEVERLSAKVKKKRSLSKTHSLRAKFVKNVNKITRTVSPIFCEENIGGIIANEDTSSDLPPERPRRHKRRTRTSNNSETHNDQGTEETLGSVVPSAPESLSPAGAFDYYTDEEILPRENAAVKEQRRLDHDTPTHVSVSEIKERCKIAIEGHPYERNLVFQKRARSSFKLKDLFANSKK